MKNVVEMLLLFPAALFLPQSELALANLGMVFIRKCVSKGSGYHKPIFLDPKSPLQAVIQSFAQPSFVMRPKVELTAFIYVNIIPLGTYLFFFLPLPSSNPIVFPLFHNTIFPPLLSVIKDPNIYYSGCISKNLEMYLWVPFT